jgi:putative membrane protein
MMFWYGSHWAFWQAGLMWLGMIAFWALVIWAVFALVRSASGGSSSQPGDEPPTDNARRILDERLAKGEIDVEEYRRLRDAMSSDADHATAGGSR